MANRAQKGNSPGSTGPEPALTIQRRPDDRPVSPPSGTYAILIPRDQIYRVPPPESANLVRQYYDRRSCRRCCFLFLFLFLILLLAGISAAVFYFVVKPEAPNNYVTGIAINGLDLTSTSVVFLAVDVTVRAANATGKAAPWPCTTRKPSSVTAFCRRFTSQQTT